MFISLRLSNKLHALLSRVFFFFISLLYWALFSHAWCPSVFEGLRFKFSVWAFQRFRSLTQPMAFLSLFLLTSCFFLCSLALLKPGSCWRSRCSARALGSVVLDANVVLINFTSGSLCFEQNLNPVGAAPAGWWWSQAGDWETWQQQLTSSQAFCDYALKTCRAALWGAASPALNPCNNVSKQEFSEWNFFPPRN